MPARKPQAEPSHPEPPQRPATGPLAALESLAAVCFAVAVTCTTLVLTPLGRQPVVRAFLPAAQWAWRKAWAVGAAAFLAGLIPRHLNGWLTPLDHAFLAVARILWRLLVRLVLGLARGLWVLIQGRHKAPASDDRTPTSPLARALRRLAARIQGALFPPAPAPAPAPAGGAPLIPGGPPLSLLAADAAAGGRADAYSGRVVAALAELGVAGVEAAGEVAGATVASVQITLPPGVRASHLESLAPDLAVSIGAQSVRIRQVVGKPGTVAVEVPLPHRRTVYLRQVLESEPFRAMAAPGAAALPVAMGLDTSATPVAFDLATAPHMLVAGGTGQGKSVFLNTLLCSLLVTRTPAQLRLVLIDPKAVELARFAGLPHLAVPPVDDMAAVAPVLRWLVAEMEARYQEMKRHGVNRIRVYNARAAEEGRRPFAHVLLVVDELADLMVQTRRRKKEEEGGEDTSDLLLRLAQKARACGIHLVLATQRPSVDVITGTIKANVDARVAFRVSSHVDSKVILDQPGAEALVGRGDMLFRGTGGDMIRAQAPFVDDGEIEAIIRWWTENWHGEAGLMLVPPPGAAGSHAMGDQVPSEGVAMAGQPPARDQPQVVEDTGFWITGE